MGTFPLQSKCNQDALMEGIDNASAKPVNCLIQVEINDCAIGSPIRIGDLCSGVGTALSCGARLHMTHVAPHRHAALV